MSVDFGRVKALRKISINLGQKGVTGLIGANGAGKTTLIHVVLGLLDPTRGVVTVGEERIAYCPDTPSFEPFLNADEVLDQSACLANQTLNQGEAKDLLERVGLSEASHRRVGGFSRGMKQRLGVAAALSTHPDILILDEPTSALDPAGREEMMTLIARLGQAMAVVFSSHILSDVESVATRLVVLDFGSVLFDGDFGSLLDQHGADDYMTVELVGIPRDVLRILGNPTKVDPSPADRGEALSERASVWRVHQDLLRPLLQALERSPGSLRRIEVGHRSLQSAYNSLVRDPS